MEVHHHPDLHDKKKNFKEHLFEFFMLFLAITLGFFVENIREHLVENNRENDYVHSIAEDLKQDIYQLDSIIAKRTDKNQMMDSILYMLNYSNPNEHGNDIYYYARWLTINDYQKDLDEVFKFTCDTFADIHDHELEEFDNAKKMKTSWKQFYDIEQMMEHAIVHVLRHRRQIEKFKIELKR